MTTVRTSLPVLLTLALTLGCDSGTKDAKPAAAAKTADAKTADAKADDATPPDATKAPTNPHASPHAPSNPHANMPPMMGAPPKQAGPPRDITPSGETSSEDLLGLGLAVPTEWEKGTPSNPMRVAQWVLPGPGGDGELVVFRFAGGGGGIQANLDRWKGQFTPPEGKTIDDVSTTKEIEGTGGLKTTLVDVTGTFASGMPGGPATPQSDSRMLAAIVEGSGDPFYFKAVGPKATIDLWAAPYDTMIASFAPTKADAAAGGDATADAPADGDAKAAAPQADGEG